MPEVACPCLVQPVIHAGHCCLSHGIDETTWTVVCHPEPWEAIRVASDA